ncbi:MAG: M35 family metallo-endopeptidase [Cyanobacteriota bacterium]|nr:M35 family metallo-endopeptidase [Cyanobacteriota bacterium]
MPPSNNSGEEVVLKGGITIGNPAAAQSGAGSPDVLIGGQSAIRIGDTYTCPVNGPSVMTSGSSSVFINGRPACRTTDTGQSAKDGSPVVIVGNSSNVFIGGGTVSVNLRSDQAQTQNAQKQLEAQESQVPGLSSDEAKRAIQQALQDQRTMLESKKAELERWDNLARYNFNKWFGTTDEQARQLIQDWIDKMLDLNEQYSLDNFQAGSPSDLGLDNPSDFSNIFAYVYPDRPDTIYLGPKFATAPATGINSRAGTLNHEMSHFDIIGGTIDHFYGTEKSLELARDNSQLALENADNFAYYTEEQLSPLESILGYFMGFFL